MSHDSRESSCNALKGPYWIVTDTYLEQHFDKNIFRKVCREIVLSVIFQILLLCQSLYTVCNAWEPRFVELECSIEILESSACLACDLLADRP